MDLLLPDTGLLFWMVVIFAIVFFLLAKFAFPVIGRMVDKRNAYIADALREADAARESLSHLAEEQAQLLEQTRREQAQLMRQAAEEREKVLARSREEAAAQGAMLLEQARSDIEAEKTAALREIRRQVALLSLEMAGRLVDERLSADAQQQALSQRLLDEIAWPEPSSDAKPDGPPATS